jgi:hypothetical protein
VKPADPAARVPTLDELLDLLVQVNGGLVRHYFDDVTTAQQESIAKAKTGVISAMWALHDIEPRRRSR